MKICLINNLYHPFIRGGAERVVEKIADELKKEHQIFFISTKLRGKEKPQTREKIYHLNSLFYNLNKIPLALRFFWHFWDMIDPICYFKIKKILKAEKPDLVITHNLKGLGFLTTRAVTSLGIKQIHTLHDIQLLHPSGLMFWGREKKIQSWPAKIYARACAWLFNSPTAVISPSTWLLELHESKGFFKKSKKIVLPNPAPITIKEITKEKKADNSCFDFLYVGLIEGHKGMDLLFDAFSDFAKNQEKTVRLLLAGTGSKLFELSTKIQEKNLEKQILILGWQEKNQIKNLMQTTDCLIMPSLCYENSPTVIYEAAAAGLPVIASRIGGITELTHELGGLLFTPGNKKNLLKKMRYAIEQPQEMTKISEQSRLKIKKMQSKNYIKKLLALI